MNLNTRRLRVKTKIKVIPHIAPTVASELKEKTMMTLSEKKVEGVVLGVLHQLPSSRFPSPETLQITHIAPLDR
jgi:hypothetical protein